MTRLLELLIAVAIVLVLMVVVGFFLPSHQHVSRSVEVNRKPLVVHDLMNNFSRFPAWSALGGRDTKFQLAGQRRGKGAEVTYASMDEAVGNGKWRISESSSPEKIVYEIDNDSRGENKKSVLTIEPIKSGKLTEITWSYDVDYGSDLIGRYAGMYVKRHVGDRMDAGLAKVKDALFGIANADYQYADIQRVMVKPQNVLFKSNEVPTAWDEVLAAYMTSVNELYQTAEKNNLKPVGVPRLVTTGYSDNYRFDVAVPIAPLAEGEAFPKELYDSLKVPQDGEELFFDTAPEDLLKQAQAKVAASFDADVSFPMDGAVTEQAPLVKGPDALDAEALALELPDDITLGRSYGGPALRMDMVAHMISLPAYRNDMRAYASANGLQVTDRAFERFVYDSEKVPTDRRAYMIYWPVK